ncbi:type IV pilus assembly protein PilC [Caloramator quimbayensis]|uniref:Type IV pilus assembly protein PilC n=1 Tax=Caloramator quimbayensis TaxID=1147123 RepID=A0A1T4WY73_9CLOT|nr:type II secretion system F family protein [Caloramator quimbayensis]SKA81808.1 type IV pilus assembly protein PilC [Caloramator quimbayensis]
MPVYKYRAKSINGDTISGEVIAEDEKSAIGIIREYGYYPCFIKNCSKNISDFFTPAKINNKELFMLCRQIYLFNSSGVNIIQAFQIIKEGMSSKLYKDYFEDVIKNIKRGMSISSALCINQKVPDILIKMIKVGENCGKLDEIMESMAEYFEWKYKSEQKLRQILIYPIFVAVFAFIVINILLFKVIPSFITIFNQFNIKDFPLTTRIIIYFSSFIRDKQITLIIFFVVLSVIVKMFLNSKNLNLIKFMLPFYNKIYSSIIWLNFVRAFSMLVSSGISIIESIDICIETIDDNIIKRHLTKALDIIKEGSSISYALASQKIVPQNIIKLIKIGEESGNLDIMLKKCFEIYEIEVENQSERVISIIEPLVIAFLSVVVGFIVISIIMPIFQIYDVIG